MELCTSLYVFSAEVSVTSSGTAQMCLSPPLVLEGVMVGKQQLFKHSGMSYCSPLDSLYLPYKMHKETGNLIITAGKKNPL